MIQNVSSLIPSGIWGIKGATSGFDNFSSIFLTIFPNNFGNDYNKKYQKYEKDFHFFVSGGVLSYSNMLVQFVLIRSNMVNIKIF